MTKKLLQIWTDETSYSQSETKRIPRTWYYRTPYLTIKIHRLHYEPTHWFLTCHDLNITNRPLRATSIERARDEGLRVLRAKLQSTLKSLKPIVVNA